MCAATVKASPEKSKAEILRDQREGKLEYVPLNKIDTKHYPNTRDVYAEYSRDALRDFRGSVHSLGQQQPCQSELIVAKDGSNKGIHALIMGFRRYEALKMNAVEHLFNKYNKEKGLEKEKKLIVENPDHQKVVEAAYPTEWDQVLASTNIKVNSIVVPGDTPEKKMQFARIKNYSENALRQDFTPAESCFAMANLVDQGMTQKEIADYMGVALSKVSQEINIGTVLSPDRLVDYLTTGGDADDWSEDLLAQYVDVTTQIAHELVRRMGVANTKEHPDGVPFSHLRELFPLVNKEGRGKAIHRKAALELVCKLVNCSVNEADDQVEVIFADRKVTPDYGDWKDMVKNAKLASKTYSGGGEETAATATDPAHDPDMPEATSEDLEVGDDEGEPSEGDDEAAADKAAVEATAKEGGAVDNAALLASSGKGGEAPKKDAETAAGKRAEAPEETIIMKKPEAVLGQSKNFLARLLNPAKPGTKRGEAKAMMICEPAIMLGGIEQGFWVCNDADRSAEVVDLHQAYAKAVQDYVEALEDYADKARASFETQGLKPFPLARPQLLELVDDKGKVKR